MLNQKTLNLLHPVEELIAFRRNREIGNYVSSQANAIGKMRAIAMEFIPGVRYAIESDSHLLLKELLLLYAGNNEDFSNIFGRNAFDTNRCDHFGSYIIALRKAFPEARLLVFDFTKMPSSYYDHHTEADLIREGKIFFREKDEFIVKRLILRHFERSTLQASNRPVRKTLTREKAFEVAMVHLFLHVPQVKEMLLSSGWERAILELKIRVNSFKDFQKYITGSILHKSRYRRGEKSFSGWQEALDFIVSKMRVLDLETIQRLIAQSEKKRPQAA